MNRDLREDEIAILPCPVQHWICTLKLQKLKNPASNIPADTNIILEDVPLLNLNPLCDEELSIDLDESTTILKNISRDAARTFTDLKYFSCVCCNAVSLLEELLLSLHIEFGYCQGMNFIAGYFLYHLRKCEDKTLLKTSKYILLELFNNPKYDLRSSFQPGMLQVQIRIYQFNSLFNTYLPELFYHFKEKEIGSDYFVIAFMIPLFTNKFPFAFLEKFFTFFLEDGWRVVFSSLLFVLSYFQQELLDMKITLLSHFFQRSNKRLSCLAEIFSREMLISKFNITDTKLADLECEFISLKLGLNSVCSSPIRINEVNLAVFEEANEQPVLDNIQSKFSSFNYKTQCETSLLKSKIEVVNREKHKLRRLRLKLDKKINHILLEMQDNLLAKHAIQNQLSICARLENINNQDIAQMKEKLLWITEEISEKRAIISKLQHKSQDILILTEELKEKKCRFSEQLLVVLNSAEAARIAGIQKLKSLVA